MEDTIIAAHDSHPEHELELKHYQKPYSCNGCKEQGVGPRFRCDSCEFDLHEHCMFTAVTTSHEFFPSSATFKFLHQPPEKGRYCDACGQTVKGFVYHCEDKDWDLHPCCLNLKNEIDTVDGVKFKLRDDKVSAKCIWCKKRNVKGSRETKIKGWSYLSECKEYHFHVHCAMEMVLEAWKDGGNENGKMPLALENFDRKVLAKKHRNGRAGNNKFLRIVKIFLKTIACILLGDPTITLACLVFELVT